ncbi:MAG: 50S ribosomal protein L10 [Candidatus Vogelbacteria bacterium]|nr:50S ribosomal protein L10 [Candidatus Vogelbacteria bacterium]
MPLKKAQKKEISSKLVEKIADAGSAVFVNFGKLTSADSNAIRSGLRENGVGYMVSKKSLLKRALAETKIAGDMPKLEGQISIAFGKDSIIPAKSVAEFQSKLKDKMSIVGGLLSGKFLSASEMIALSKIPSREVLLSQLLNVMNSSIQGFVMSLDQIAKKKA